jgi:hypothetical protein
MLPKGTSGPARSFAKCRRIPLRVGANTYIAFCSVVSTAKANGASVLATVRLGPATKRSAEALGWGG